MEDIDYVRLNYGAVFSSGSRPSERMLRRTSETASKEREKAEEKTLYSLLRHLSPYVLAFSTTRLSTPILPAGAASFVPCTFHSTTSILATLFSHTYRPTTSGVGTSYRDDDIAYSTTVRLYNQASSA